MKIRTGSGKEFDAISISASINPIELRPLISITFNPDKVSVEDVINEFKAGGFNDVTATSGNITKNYEGYVYLVNLSERFSEYENSLVIILSNVAENTPKESGINYTDSIKEA